MRNASVAFLLLFTSCGIINNSGGGRLTKEQYNFVKPYTERESGRSSDTFRLLETDGKRLCCTLAGTPYTWVYFWTYYCKGETCRSLRYYTDLEKSHAAGGLTLTLVSQVYDVDSLRNNTKEQGWQRPVLVPESRLYTQNMYRARRHFCTDLTDSKVVGRSSPAHLIFRQDSLIYTGSDMTATLLDSVMQLP